jgi:tetrahydromethanopterin S-methyltransferase subunit G
MPTETNNKPEEQQKAGRVSLSALLGRKRDLEKSLDEIARQLNFVDDEIMRLKAQFKIGDTITWDTGVRRGIVEGYFDWVEQVGYLVTNLRKDGTEGSKARIRPYQKPRLSP